MPPFLATDAATVAESWQYFNQRMSDMGLRDPEIIDKHGIVFCPADRVIKYGISQGLIKDRPAIIFPYLNEFGKKLDFFQARMIGGAPEYEAPLAGMDRAQFEKLQKKAYPKYLSGRQFDLYYPIFSTPWLEQTFVFITEGIPKAIRACRAGLPCLSIQGKDLYKRRGSTRFVDGLERLLLSTKLQKIIYIADSDARTNEGVKDSAVHLIGLLNGRRQSDDFASYAILPELQKDVKTGLDDYINARSPEEFLKQLDNWLQKWEGGAWAALIDKLNLKIKRVRGTTNYVDIEGHRVVSESAIAKEVQPTLASTPTLINPYSGRKLDPRSITLKNTFESDPFSNSCDGVDFWPGMSEILPDGSHNLWYDCSPEAVEGDISPFLNLIEFTIPDQYERELVIQLIAHRILYPHEISPLIIFMFGAEGTGKSNIMRCLFGAITSNEKYIHEGGLRLDYAHEDQHLFKQAVCLEEPTKSGMTNADMSAVFKLLGDSDTLHVNPKGIQGYKIRNRMLMWVNSNEHYVPATGAARRWLFVRSALEGHGELTKACREWRDGFKNEGKLPVLGGRIKYWVLSQFPSVSAYDLQVAAAKVVAKSEILDVNRPFQIVEYEEFLASLPSELVNLGAIPNDIMSMLYPYLEKRAGDMQSIRRHLSSYYPVVKTGNEQNKVYITGQDSVKSFRCTKVGVQMLLNVTNATEIYNKWARHPQLKLIKGKF